MLVLGIESSCDETAAAIVRDGREMLSSVISSQVDIHKLFGGVVPELASREHLDKIVGVVEEAFARAGVGQEAVDGVAVTQGPGLVGSGRHTNLFHVPGPGQYKVLARTRDDAAGEAYDKVAKMLGLGYPGGPVVERLAREGDPRAVRFSVPRMGDGRPDFSFSGLKTAVSKHVRESGLRPVEAGAEPSQAIKDLAASFQSVVVRSLTGTMERLAEELQPRTLIVAGGVACNNALRE